MKNLQYFISVAGFEFHVKELHGSEELSRLRRIAANFRLDPETMKGNPLDFDPDVVIKADAWVILREDATSGKVGSELRRIRGIITEAEVSASVSGLGLVELVIEPRMSLLTHRRDVRNHRDMSAPDIVTEVAAALGVKVESRLQGSYALRPYCVQWRESDFDYCMRLMEDEGIFYFFTDDDVMVMGDGPAAYDDLPLNRVLEYGAGAGLRHKHDAIHEFGSHATMVPGKVTLRDWNTEHPSLDMDVSSGTAMPFAPEWYDYPGEYEEPSEGTRKARLHAEAFDRAAAAHHGATTCPRMYPGCTFDMVSTTVGITPASYVVRKLDYHWQLNQTDDYTTRFEADPADTTYRPPRQTHVPRIFNPLTGFVCTNGEDIQCDHFGRVKVRQHWDRLRPFDDDVSHWIPVIQDNTGGSQAIPRKDWEVMVHFLEGDPDRPIVLGRVYNGEDTIHEQLPDAKYRSSLRSLTSPTRDSSNHIQFQDLQGQEQLFTHACKDQNVRVANDQKKSTGTNEAQVIRHDETISVGGDCTWKIGDEFAPSVQNDQSWEVTGDRKMRIGSAAAASVGNDHTLKITGDHKRKVFVEDNCNALNIKEDITGEVQEKYENLHTTLFGIKLDFNVKGSLTETIKGKKVEATTIKRVDDITANYIVFARGVYQCRCDDVRKLTVKKDLNAKVFKETNLTGAKGFELTCDKGKFRGFMDIVMQVGETEIALKNGLVRFSAPKGNIYFAISGAAKHDAAESKQN